MPALRTILATALIAAAALSAAPARSASSPYGEMGVFAGDRTNAGDWTGTWIYVWRDGRMALWLRPGKDGKLEARFQFQSTSSPETFETDWSGKSTYYLSGEPATFESVNAPLVSSTRTAFTTSSNSIQTNINPPAARPAKRRVR